ncbi:MAG: hypothetical protein UX91_C0006G0226 [Candidatus Amesbacteria bacterium GW2011_GWB1_47_19]|nr:MAG: hypothetical protein UW51_C0002G0227 [Candidatus Amesbacteria bacterium GW2011_GWA1_44_24]KKU31006.1 MAG: hypothetical protein UX46_C0008G0026 [Candidatus Amesbacteria bacterium GW2011_GWC1_46_24]KKU67164.1 MAG: hypothetical protein UX91_C0006G0226 [Candidatus Amesbacteria bacterium GW2011_GWB1_47_19]OGD05520.1 MAG: hypothetical protein A2379_01000 [Candidatus Amesbacteria bacterium RIFOXYB1_FULL_47_13]HBC73037.1 hypothetical protein [Candidatus Amesbacteria bacterium]
MTEVVKPDPEKEDELAFTPDLRDSDAMRLLRLYGLVAEKIEEMHPGTFGKLKKPGSKKNKTHLGRG